MPALRAVEQPGLPVDRCSPDAVLRPAAADPGFTVIGEYAERQAWRRKKGGCLSPFSAAMRLWTGIAEYPFPVVPGDSSNAI